MLKKYKKKLSEELKQVTKTQTKLAKRVTDQMQEFDFLEKQLISWGLPKYIPTFKMQAWFRLSRSMLLDDIIAEMQRVIERRIAKTQRHLKQADEAARKTENYTVAKCEEYCRQSPDLFVGASPEFLALAGRLQRLDVVCSSAIKRFKRCEPQLASQDPDTRRARLVEILTSYQRLPGLEEVEGIESDLPWEAFCHWYGERVSRGREVLEAFSSLVEDQREKEGRLFFRWHSALLAPREAPPPSEKPQGPSSDRSPLAKGPVEAAEAGPGPQGDGEGPRARITPALEMTPASIRAFAKYFASDMLVKAYSLPPALRAPAEQLVEALFHSRISAYVYRYRDPEERLRDEAWRLQTQLVRSVSPADYDVPHRYFHGPLPPAPSPCRRGTSLLSDQLRCSATNATDSPGPGYVTLKAFPPSPPSKTPKAPPSLEPHTLQDDYFLSQPAGPQKRSALEDSAEEGPEEGPEEGSWGPEEEQDSEDLAAQREGLPPQCLCGLCGAVRGLPQALAHCDPPPPGPEEISIDYGVAYRRSSRVLSWLSSCPGPREMQEVLRLAHRWLLRDAIEASGSREAVGADLLVPLSALVLCHAALPSPHLLLRVLDQFGDHDPQGDVSYLIANLEVALQFLSSLSVSETARARFEASPMGASLRPQDPPEPPGRSRDIQIPKEIPRSVSRSKSSGSSHPGGSPGSTSATSLGRSQDDDRAMERLGEWLRDQLTMEQTINILQDEGWMT